MAEQRLLASAIVLNFNGRDCLADCLASLVTQSYGPLEVVVADNGSSDDSEAIASAYSVRWVPLGGRFDFAHANNIAAQHANGSLLIFVNNDMRFDPGFVEALVTPLMLDSDTFATDARQFDWSGTRAIHGATYLTRPSLKASLSPRAPAFPHLAIDQFDSSVTCEAVQACAANMAVRRGMFEQLGGFDPHLPAGLEDTDICWRAWLRGWKTMFVPGAVCWHHVGLASSSESGARLRYRGGVGGRLRFAAKHLPLEDALSLWALAVAAIPRDAVRRGWKGVNQRMSVLIEASLHLPSALIERRRIYRLAGISPRRHIQRLRRIGLAKSAE
jgi:GT2 family glycosyltransferase